MAERAASGAGAARTASDCPWVDKLVVLDLSRDEQQSLDLEPIAAKGRDSGDENGSSKRKEFAKKALKGDAQKKKKQQIEIEE